MIDMMLAQTVLPQFTTEQLLGPLAALVLALIALFFGSRFLRSIISEYVQSLKDRIADSDSTCDKCEERLKEALAGWQAQTDANRILAAAQEARNRDDELQHRLADAQMQPRTRTRR